MHTRTLIFHVAGMHCNACVLLTESEAKELPFISRARSDLSSHTIEVEGDFADRTPEAIAGALTELLSPHGYSVSTERGELPTRWSEFWLAAPIALTFIAAFIFLQKLGIVNFVNGENVSFKTAFVIGIVASLSSCMAVVGGLLLSMSATFAKEGDKVKPQLLFHAGRLLSFFVLGGVIGAVGSSFALDATATFVLGLLVALVMLILGINLLDIFHWTKRLQPSMPKSLSRHAYKVSKWNHAFTPFLVGTATFFLPCGFTQSMQIYTLSTGSFLSGALTMSSFALGTMPVLSALGFSSFSIRDSANAGIFFKTAGLIVIAFALFNLANSLTAIGIIRPLFSL